MRSDTYMGQWSVSHFIQINTCCLFFTIWSNAVLSLIGPTRTNFSGISHRKMAISLTRVVVSPGALFLNKHFPSHTAYFVLKENSISKARSATGSDLPRATQPVRSHENPGTPTDCNGYWISWPKISGYYTKMWDNGLEFINWLGKIDQFCKHIQFKQQNDNLWHN